METAEITIMNPKEEATLVEAEVFANIDHKRHPFLWVGRPNKGDSCEDNMESFERAIPITKMILGNAIRQSQAGAVS